MKTHFLFLFFINFLLLSPALIYTEDEYADFYDDEDSVETGIIGFFKRHKIFTSLLAVTSCASIVLYKNPLLRAEIYAFANDIWETIKSDTTEIKQQNEGLVPQNSKKVKIDNLSSINDSKTDQKNSAQTNLYSNSTDHKVQDSNEINAYHLNPLDKYKQDREFYREIVKYLKKILFDDIEQIWWDREGMISNTDEVWKGYQVLANNHKELNIEKLRQLKHRVTGEKELKFLNKIEKSMQEFIAMVEKHKYSFCYLNTDEKVKFLHLLREHSENLGKKISKVIPLFEKVAIL